MSTVPDNILDIVNGTKVITRNMIKYPLMKLGYGQQEKGTKNSLRADMGDLFSDEMVNIFYKAVENILPGFTLLQNDVNALWNNRKTVQYVLPDGGVVTLKEETNEYHVFKLWDELEVKAKISGTSKKKFTLILFVGIIHSIDAYIAREIINRADFDILTIHDAFRCHPNNAHQMKQIAKEVYIDVLNMNLMDDILYQITGKKITTNKSKLRPHHIEDSQYIIC